MALTIEDYLKGKVLYEIPAETLASILYDRSIEDGSAMSAIPPKSADLALADLYMWCGRIPTSVTGAEDADGGWKHKGSTIQVSSAERSVLKSLANDIYRKYGESTKADIKLVNLW